jgi:hypothetical protein
LHGLMIGGVMCSPPQRRARHPGVVRRIRRRPERLRDSTRRSR